MNTLTPLEYFAAHAPAVPADWFDFCREEYGGSVTLGLHIPKNVTGATRIRIARLIGCYGLRGAQ